MLISVRPLEMLCDETKYVQRPVYNVGRDHALKLAGILLLMKGILRENNRRGG